MQRKDISFNGQSIYIGIDVHKSTWSVTVLTELSNFSKTFSQEASARKLFDFLKKNFPDGNYLAVYEAGFSGYSTYYELRSFGIDCIIVNPADVPTKDSERKTKTDAVDSAKLARSLKNGDLTPNYIPSKEYLDDKDVVRIRSVFQKQLGGYKSRVKHLLYRNGVDYPERFERLGTHWSKAFIKWLREDVKLLSDGRMSLDLLLDQVESLRRSVLASTKAMRALGQTDRHKENLEHLKTIPGIGEVTAMTLLTEIGEVGRFSNERQFTKYIGFVPNVHSSGEREGTGEMTRRGNVRLRTMLIESAWKSISTDATLAAAFGRYRQRMTPNEAIVRIARTLSHIAFAIVKNNTVYDPGRHLE